MISIEEKLKWAVKKFLLKDSKRNVLDAAALATKIVRRAKYGSAFNSGESITNVAYRVTVAYFRHNWTNYDSLVRKGGDIDYKLMASSKVATLIRQWKKGPKDLKVKDIRIN